MPGSRILCQFYLVLSLFYSLQSGSNGFIAQKTILILYFPGGGGVQMLISIETHIRTYFPGGMSRPPIPLWICTWAMSS